MELTNETISSWEGSSIYFIVDFSIKWSFGLKLNIDNTTHNHASDSETIGRLQY